MVSGGKKWKRLRRYETDKITRNKTTNGSRPFSIGKNTNKT